MSTDPAPEAAVPPRARGKRRWMLWLSWVLIAVAALLAVEGILVLAWKEPFTSFVQSRDQASLSRRLDAALTPAAAAPTPIATAPVVQRRALAAAARRWSAALRAGQPVGRLRIPAIGVTQIVVQGTDAGELRTGPGHYPATALPGMGRTVAIAGHRTTWGAPFRHLDQLRPGDRLSIQLPYATVEYRVTGTRIVDDQDFSILRETGADRLVLTACHPLYSASQRIAVFAAPVTPGPGA